MSLPERLKLIREELGHTQKVMAKTLNCSLSALQFYEAGSSVPGGNVLEALARLGFNVNWILTGEGEMRRGGSCEWWSEKIKEIRGDLTIPEFVKKVGFTDPDKWMVTIQAIEDKKMDADFSLMNVLSCQLGISVDWMFGVAGIPKFISERDSAFINIDLLKDIIKEAELYESINPGTLSPDKKAELMAELYAMRAGKGK